MSFAAAGKRVAQAAARSISTSAARAHGSAPVRACGGGWSPGEALARGVSARRRGLGLARCSPSALESPPSLSLTLPPAQHYVHAEHMYEITKVRRTEAGLSLRALRRVWDAPRLLCSNPVQLSAALAAASAQLLKFSSLVLVQLQPALSPHRLLLTLSRSRSPTVPRSSELASWCVLTARWLWSLAVRCGRLRVVF